MIDATADATLVFDRTPLARLVSCTAVFGSAAIFFAYLSSGETVWYTIAMLLVLFLGTLASALLQYGDHIYLGREGLLYRNRLFPILGSGGWMRWDEVVEIREIQRKILILFAADGRRMLVDAIAGYPVAKREILRRAPHAELSGTLQGRAET